jgi:predicted PhzF superfamily epimerase YddE/YHI9
MRVSVLNVFCNGEGKFGNPVGIVPDAHALHPDRRQAIASRLGYSETVFLVDDFGGVVIHNPQTEVKFSGHAAVGAAWYLRNVLKSAVALLSGPDGATTEVWHEGDSQWVRAKLKDTPSWWHERFSSVGDLEAFDSFSAPELAHMQAWAWIDEGEGLVRARTFAPAWGIPEDEANGSGCMRLAATLGRQLTVRHGQGSVVLARPADRHGYSEAGGLVSQADSIDVD